MEINSTKIALPNPHLRTLKRDYLYHFGLTTNDNFTQRFKDVKFLCMGGKRSRMRDFAQLVYEKLGKPSDCEFEDLPDNHGCKLKDISEAAGRYSLFKVGPVLSASHGVGSSSLSVALHELLKLMHYAGCSDVTVIRIGTSGGLGLEPGSVVITSQAYNALLEPHHQQNICGKVRTFNSKADLKVAEEIRVCAETINVKAVVGNTMATNDFYEENARLNGALCDYTEDDKINFLRRAHDEHGILYIEMECTYWIATCNRANIKSAVVCVTLSDRLLDDCITDDAAQAKEWEKYPQEVVVEFIKSRC